jgi:hypothetical protein
MSVSAAVDYVLFAASPQLLLIATVLLRGARWRIVPWCFAVASAAGAVAVALSIGVIGEAFMAVWGDSAAALPAAVAAFIQDWGLLALFLLCALPLSMRSPVFLVALGGLPALQIGLAVLGGRLVAYHLVAFAAAFAPARLARVPRLAPLLQSVGVEPSRAAATTD